MSTDGRAPIAGNEPEDFPPKPGNTPLCAIALELEETTHVVHLKMESMNPTGSVKDRTGYGLVLDLEKRGHIERGGILIESTSGNLGVALAFLCAQRHYRFIAIVDPKTTAENLTRMQELGACIEMVEHPDETGGYLFSRLERVQTLLRRYPHAVWTNQYENLANPLIHYQTTAPEIYAQMHGCVDAIFVAVSTGGTLAGIARYFREVSPATRIIAVDARGSVVFGGAPGPRKLTGIGSSRPSSFLSADLYDAFLLVTDEEAFVFCRWLEKLTDLKVGGSSGATLAACARYLANHPQTRHVVCVCADRGEHYASSIYSDLWLQNQGLKLTGDHLGPVHSITLLKKGVP
jgi:2,3-diaminopropionate biosynthesis protein SbnA